MNILRTHSLLAGEMACRENDEHSQFVANQYLGLTYANISIPGR
jgi:hypothetical protein